MPLDLDAIRKRAEAADIPALIEEVESLRKALTRAIKIADEVREEWDKAPSGMKAGKLLIALSGHLPNYRAEIDEIHSVAGTPAPVRPTPSAKEADRG